MCYFFFLKAEDGIRDLTVTGFQTCALPICLLREPVGWILPKLHVFSATGKPRSRAFLSRAGSHAQTLHERFFCHLQLPHLQLDELRTRLRSYKQVLWLWLAIDPLTKLLHVLYLGPRTQNMAQRVIHSLRQLLAAFLSPALHQ